MPLYQFSFFLFLPLAVTLFQSSCEGHESVSKHPSTTRANKCSSVSPGAAWRLQEGYPSSRGGASPPSSEAGSSSVARRPDLKKLETPPSCFFFLTGFSAKLLAAHKASPALSSPLIWEEGHMEGAGVSGKLFVATVAVSIHLHPALTACQALC